MFDSELIVAKIGFVWYNEAALCKRDFVSDMSGVVHDIFEVSAGDVETVHVYRLRNERDNKCHNAVDELS